MRVLWLAERFPPQKGGVAASAGRQVRLLAPELERLDVLNLTADLPPGRVETSDFHGAHIHRLGRAAAEDESQQLLLEAALALARSGGHRLIHGFYAVWSGYTCVLAGRRLGLPSVVSLRGNDVDRGMFQGARFPFLLWTLEHASALAPVSQELRARVAALSGRTQGVSVLPNGVDAGFFSPGRSADHPPLGLDPAPRPWIAFSGELRLKKGLPLLLDLAADLERQQAGTLFAIGGARPEAREQISAWRQAHPHAARRFVEIPWLRDAADLREHYRAMDLFVFPSLWDGMPNALLEAMACAKPVLAAASGGIRDVVEDGRSGVLLAPERLDSLPEAAASLCARPAADLAGLGHGARQRVLERFTPEAEKSALLELYQSLA